LAEAAFRFAVPLGALKRMIDIGIEPFLVNSALPAGKRAEDRLINHLENLKLS